MNWLRLKFFPFVLLFALLLACSNDSYKEYLSTLKDLGWDEHTNGDSLFVLFTSVNQCLPCDQEIQKWNEKYGKSDKVLLIVKEKYISNFENYITTNSINLNSLQDKKGLFRDKELIPFLPYKIVIIENTVKELGELGND
ncbi:MAG: hypothetical protein ABJR05_06110 [Balneola sp.]